MFQQCKSSNVFETMQWHVAHPILEEGFWHYNTKLIGLWHGHNVVVFLKFMDALAALKLGFMKICAIWLYSVLVQS